MNRTNDQLRDESGQVNSSSALVSFLYCLMRDKLPAGEVEQLAREAVKFPESQFTNGWLAEYAQNLARDLQSDKNLADGADH